MAQTGEEAFSFKNDMGCENKERGISA